MSYCPVPDTVDITARTPTPAVLTVNPPAATSDVCVSTVTTSIVTGGGTNTNTTTTVVGPPGPPGPQGPAGEVEWPGLQWKGIWTEGEEYKQSRVPEYPNADVIRCGDRLYVCIADHIADQLSMPRLETFTELTDWEAKWELMVAGDTAAIADGEEQSFLDSLKDDFFDWFNKPWSIGDWLGAAAAVAGIIWAGSSILDMMTGDGDSAGGADVRYNGSPTHTGFYTPPSVRVVVQSLCMEAGIEHFDVSLLPTDVPCHFSLAQQTSVRNIMDNMSRAFQFDIVDSSGVLKFVPRQSAVTRAISADEMGFNSANEVSAPYTTKRLQSVDLPRSVTLSYIAEDLDYNTFSQRTEIPTFEQGNDVTLEVPFMLSHALAKEATDKLLIGSHLERTQYFFKTSYKHIDLEPGDIVAIPGAQARVMQIEETEEGILEFICCDAGVVGAPAPIVVGGVTIGYTASTYIGTNQNPQLPAPVDNAAPVIGFSDAMFIDPPVMSAEDTVPRVYAMIHGYGAAGWPGAQLFMSRDGGGSYSLIAGTSNESVLGLSPTPIAVPGRGYHTWDDLTTVDIQLKTGSLTSKPDIAVLNGENYAMIGQECVAFGTATLIGPMTYRLSHLLRGRRGTEWAIQSHTQNELFALLNGYHIEIAISDADRGQTFMFKTVTNGSDLVVASSKAVQIVGENTRPWTVGSVDIAQTGSDWKVDWNHRPRFNGALTDFTEIMSDPDFAGFAVVVYSGTAVKRQQVISGKTWTYTSAMQTADFGTAQSSVKIGISTISTKYGGGREIVVNP